MEVSVSYCWLVSHVPIYPTCDLQEVQSAGICRGSDSLNTVRPAKAQEGPISDPEKLPTTLRLDTEAPTFQHREDCSQSKKAVLLQEKTRSGRSNDSRVIIHHTM